MLYHRLLLLHLLLLATASTPTHGAVFVEGNCYRDDLVSTTVTVSGGHYDPEELLPDICKDICGRLDYIYSAIDEGKYCFCMDSIDVMIEAPVSCTATCPNETECEGLTPGLIQVWEASVLTGELSFTFNADTFNFIVGETLNLTVTATGTWIIDWGDGSGHNLNGTQHVYTLPGEFVIVAFLELVPTVRDGIRVIVLEEPNATLECPALVTVGEVAECHLITSTQGYDNVVTVTFTAPDIPSFTFHVPGERTQGYGSVQGSASLSSSVSLNISQAIILHSNGVRAGYLSRIQLTAQTAGSVAFYAVTPKCESGNYCWETRECKTECTPDHFIQNCSAHFCTNNLKCSWSDCLIGTEPSTSHLQYRLIHTISVGILDEPFIYMLDDTTVVEVYDGEMLAVGCLLPDDCQSEPPQISTRLRHTTESTNVVVTYLDATTVSKEEHLPMRLLVSVTVREHQIVNMNYKVKCSAASSVPSALIPVPYTEDTAVYSLQGHYSLTYTIANELLDDVNAWTSGASIMCQEAVVTPELASEVWVPLLISTPFHIFFFQGAPLFSSLNLGPEVIYKYFDNATSGIWDVQLNYTTTGNFTLMGNASNALSWVEYSSLVHVVPVVTDKWVVTALCPCLAVSEGFNFSLDLAAAPNPPFTALVYATLSNGILLLNKSLDFGTSTGIGASQTLRSTFNVTVLEPGNYSVTFVLTNEVSNTTITTQVLVEEGLANVTSTAGYLLDGSLKPGMGELQNSFMANTTILFKPFSLKGLASVEKWRLSLSGEELDVADLTNETLSHAFTMEGEYQVVVSGYNSVQGWVNSDPFLIVVLTKLQGFELDDDGAVVEPNVTKELNATFTVLPPVSCLLIDYGDNSSHETYGYEAMCVKNYPNTTYMGPHQNPMPLHHVYKEEGRYLISALAIDTRVSYKRMLQVVIASLPCNMPEVEIVDRIMFYDKPQVNWRSLSFVKTTKARIECSRPVPVSRWWTIVEVDKRTGEPQREIQVENVLTSWNFSQLDITPLFLELGVYKLTYWIRLEASKIFPLERADYTYVEIIPSPLQAVIIGGSVTSVSRGFGQSLVLNPQGLSVDPDDPEDKTFNVTWWCRQVEPQLENYETDDNGRILVYNKHPVSASRPSESLTGGGCFGRGPGTLEMYGGYLELDTSSFVKSDATYEIKVRISKDTRESYAGIEATIIQHPPPNIQIKCVDEKLCWPYNGGLLINPSFRLALLGSCISDCSNNMNFSWSITDLDKGSLDESPSGFLTSKMEKDLAVTPEFFSNNLAVTQFRFRLTVETETLSKGFAEIMVILNSPPSSGKCALTKDTVPALVGYSSAYCLDWLDPEDMGIVSYAFYYPDGNTEKTMVASGFSTVDLIFPVGYFQVWCRIQDKFGSYTDVFVGNVSSKMITEEEFQKYNASATLQYLASVGNQEKLGMALVGIASIRENADWLSLESKVFTNMTEDEIFERLDDVTIMNKESLEFASQTMDFATLPQLNAGVGVLKSTACGILTQEMAAYTIDMEIREDSLRFMDKMSLKLNHVPIHSPYELRPFITSYLDACACLLKSMNIIIENPEMSPVGDLKKALHWDYETFISENDIGFAVPLDRKTQLKQNVLETTRQRAKFVVKKMFDLIDNLSNQILTKSVVGELINEKSESGATMFVSKVTEESLKSGLEINLNDGLNSSVKLPESFCPSHYNDKDTDCKNVIGLIVVLWPCITHVYPGSQNLLTRKTTVLDIKVNINDDIVNVINETKPIIMSISRNYEPLPKPIFVEAKKAISNHVPFVYHSFNISNTDSAFTVEFTPTGDLPPHLVILTDHKRLPTPSQYGKILTVNKLPVNENRTYTWFLNSMENENRTGKIYLAVALLKDGIDVSDFHVNRTLKNEDFIKEFDQDYELRVITSGCYFYDSARDHWSGFGLKCVGATRTHTYCEAHHLTPFGSGYFPVPNTVDFEYVFANKGFIDNLMIYLVMIITFSCFMIMLIWARFMDKKDIEYRGVTPLDDNNVEDKYLYEITFTTGPDKEAGTNSNIQFIASGEYDETDVRYLPSSEGRRYHRYSVDAFVMSTRGPLGFINYLRIWHDNSGNPPFDNWQLQTVIVRDLQTRDKYIFEANTWLAFDRGDIAVDVLLKPSEGEFNSRFSRDFYNKINRNANDDHMWMSIFLRPIGSRFSRKERVSVGALFLYLSMLFSAVWYETLSDSPRTGIIEFGLFTLSFEQVVIGVISGVLAYPLILIHIFVFKRARPSILKKCRALEAIVKQWKYQQKDKELQIDKDENLNNYDFLSHQSSSNPSKEQSSVTCIPWWTRWLAWLLIMTGIFVSVFFVWSYGITWGEIKTVKWFSSFITSFFISLLFTEWLKVLFVTSVSVLCCKKIDSFFEDIDCDEELPELRYDEEWKNAQPMDPFTRRKVHRIRGVDSKEPKVAAIATRLTKKREMGFVIRDITAYCFFLTVLYILVNGQMDYNAFLLQSHMTNAFIKIGHRDLDFSSKIITADHFWRWAQNVILQEIRAQRWYNNEPPYGLKGFLEDRDNRIMGYGILRQIRSDPRTCKVIKPLNQLINSCSGRREIDREDTRNFCDGWSFEEKFPGECHYDEFRYKSAAQLETYPLQGKLGSYSGGGYVIRLNGRQSDDLDKLRTLQEMGWIDRHTRAVMLEFSTFNANVNLFTTGTVIAEFNEGGGITPKWRFEPVRLLSHSGGFGFIIFICECIFVIATFLFTLWEFWKIKKIKCEYFASYWNITEICILVTSYITLGIYVNRYFLTKEAITKFNNTYGNGYVRFDSAVLMDKIYFNLIAIIVFFSTLKLIKLLQFNKRMDVLALTIRLCWNELSVFFIAFGIVFFAFCCLFYFVFIAAIEEFARFITAIETCFKMMLGKFDFEAMNQANPISPVLFFVFSVMNSMILINIMLTIILKAFNEVKIDLECRKNKYDLIDFVWSSVRQALNLEKAPNNTVTPDVLDMQHQKNNLSCFNTDDLTDKVSQLMTYVSDVYFDGHLNLNDPAAVKHIMRGTIPSVPRQSTNRFTACADLKAVISSN